MKLFVKNHVARWAGGAAKSVGRPMFFGRTSDVFHRRADAGGRTFDVFYRTFYEFHRTADAGTPRADVFCRTPDVFYRTFYEFHRTVAILKSLAEKRGDEKINDKKIGWIVTHVSGIGWFGDFSVPHFSVEILLRDAG